MKMKSLRSGNGRVFPVRPNDLQQVHQLIHQPREFAQLPRRRFALWPFRQAALAKRALKEAHDQQIVALNLLSEGVAFGLYGAGTPVQDKLKILGGRYANADAEMHRSTIELTPRDKAVCNPPSARSSRQLLRHWVRLSQQMLGSWLGLSGTRLKQI
jgi:hypothetical protein